MVAFSDFVYPNPSIDVVHAQENYRWIEECIELSRNDMFDDFARATLERSYLINGENPQFMWMRVAIGIHGDDEQRIRQTYDMMSQGYLTHATPTLYHAGTMVPQMSSCFLLAMKDDSIDGIYQTLRDCALISKTAGGIGMHCSNVRGKSAKIAGTNGKSNGLVPMLRVFNDTARYVDQGGGKRKGSFAIYLEPWHWDVLDFLDLRKNTGQEEDRARDLFLALWVPDLFMERVRDSGMWTLFCPKDTPDLVDLVGDDFRRKFEMYEDMINIRKTEIPARTLWNAILASQTETGTPYIMFKDACNKKSNQQHLGTIKSSNLCTEIVEYSDSGNTAVCNLGSIALPKFVNPDDKIFDFDHLRQVTRVLTRNLDRVIDRNYYPTPEAAHSNLKTRPIGIGVQGLADVFAIMEIPYDSAKALAMSECIAEHIYYAAIQESVQLAREFGPYPAFEGSPMSKGIFQFNMWNHQPKSDLDWKALAESVAHNGMRNSQLTAQMPTASTAQILGNAEAVDPYQSNIFTRRVLAGNFIVMNKRLKKKLVELDLWDEYTEEFITKHRGSIQEHPRIPDDIKAVYKTVWEIKQKWVVDHMLARAPFIDQAQSMSLNFAEIDDNKLTSAIFYAWKKGSKNGVYYVRTLPKTNAVAFTACTSCSA